MRGVLGIAGVVAVLIALVLGMRFSLDNTRFAPHSDKSSRSLRNASATITTGVSHEPAVFSAVESGGEFRGLQVVSVTTGSVADQHFGLLVGDLVVRIGPFDMGDGTLPDFTAAHAWMNEAYLRRNLTLGIERNGEELALPIGGNTNAMPAIASGGVDGSSNPSDKSPQITNPGGDE